MITDNPYAAPQTLPDRPPVEPPRPFFYYLRKTSGISIKWVAGFCMVIGILYIIEDIYILSKILTATEIWQRKIEEFHYTAFLLFVAPFQIFVIAILFFGLPFGILAYLRAHRQYREYVASQAHSATAPPH
ncbi:MAG: hypothetical protein SFX18_14180 [Pirellulales bacterium]|nr:hypothetical protein [Pirellulales bacterium]